MCSVSLRPEDETDLLVAVVVLLVALAAGGLALMRFGIHRLRGLDAERRRAATQAARQASNDPHGRAAVAALQGPGVLRVQLLWIRGDSLDPSFAEVRTLAERRVEEDDGGRAEDAVAELSEIALRADSAHALRHQSGLRALGLRRRRQRPGDRLSPPAAAPAAEKAERAVDLGWRPEPLTDEGQGELARRLVTAERERWSASVLEPLLVTRAADAPRDAPPWPERRKAKPIKNDLVVMRRYWMWGAIVTAGLALAADGDAALRVAIAGVAAVVALAAGLGPRLSRATGAVLGSRTPSGRPPRARRARSSRVSPGPPACSPSRAVAGAGSPSSMSGRRPTTAGAASWRCGRWPRSTSPTTTSTRSAHSARSRPRRSCGRAASVARPARCARW